MQKIEKASKYRGPKLFIVHTPCPTGWGFDPSETIKLAKLAVECGIWPLKEAIYGEVKHTVVPRTLKPVVTYLQKQARFKHLFTQNNTEAINVIQENIYEYWRRVKETENVEIEIPKQMLQKA